MGLDEERRLIELTLAVAMFNRHVAGGLHRRVMNNDLVVLAHLASFTGDAYVRDMQAVTGLTGAGTSKLIDRMVDEGLVRRTFAHNPDDQRLVAVHLTAAGRKELRTTMQAMSGLLSARPEMLQRVALAIIEYQTS